MVIAAGTRLGPFEILSPLGAGGMGEVYRARDTRLGREVAIKVLPEDVSSNSERLKRFEREAQAASALSHPNIVTIYEVAKAGSTWLIAMELVDGKTLRELITSAPLPVRRLLTLAPQIADGLARAHASGIVHRDLKPENVMVTRDGLAKILDFGLAKLMRADSGNGEGSRLPTQTGTSPGVVMGTVCYMSPEQACGHPVDFRSDQFSFGAMLYEMATGQPAFRRPTAPQTLSSIIEDEPEAIGLLAPKTPAPLRWVIERCLSKEPKGRYASTEDLARELADLRDHVSELSSGSGVAIAAPTRPRWRAIGAVIAGLAALAGMYLLGQRIQLAHAKSPKFRQLTFRGAGIGTARFAPDGQTIVFSAQTEGRPPELFSTRLDSPEVRSLGLPPSHILSISNSGEMAILLLRPFALVPRIGHMALEQIPFLDSFLFDGTLAATALAGGAPREVLENVSFADWASDGRSLAVVHRTENRNRVEFPIGRAIYDEKGELLNHLRTSARNGHLAFKDWGAILTRKAEGPALEVPHVLAYEIAWSDATGEIWYTMPNPPVETEIHAVTPEGRDRPVATLPGDFVLYDIAPDGRVLMGRLVMSTEILGSFPDAPVERNLSYFDHSVAVDLSAAGDSLLFTDAFRPEFTGPGGVYLRKTDGSPPKRLGQEVQPHALSPNGSVVLGDEADGVPGDSRDRLVLLPTGPGETRTLEIGSMTTGTIDSHYGFFPDGTRFFFPSDAADGRRIWVMDLDGRQRRPVTPRGVRRAVLVGDGRFLCGHAADGWYLYPVDGGAPIKALGILPGEELIRSTSAGLLYVRGAYEQRPGEALMTDRVYRVDPSTGRRELWKEIPPRDPRTGGAVSTILLSEDGKTCFWTHLRYSTELVLVEGLR